MAIKMDKSLLVLYWILITKIQANYIGILREYCRTETFHAKCPHGQVIVMTHAEYGRMQLGRCLTKGYGVLNCGKDMLQVFDNKCSGLNECNVPVFDQELIDQISCIEELSAYLEARYICKTVLGPPKSRCHSQEIIEANKHATFLSSVVSMETNCGLHDTPWVIQAKNGQQITITLTDFSWRNDTKNCLNRYGYMLDTQDDDIISICGGGSRERHLYLSTGNVVQIILHETALEDNRFLLQFKAIGCPHYERPPHSWIEIENDTVIVNCQSSPDSWTLKCVENNWLGVVGNCPATTTEKGRTSPTEIVMENTKVPKLPNVSKNHVIAFSMACATIMICCIIIILGYYCTKRYEVKSKMKKIKDEELFPANNTILRIPAVYKSVLRKSKAGTATTQPPSYTAANEQQCAPPVPHRASSYRGDMSESMMSDYLAPHGGDDNSVKYYILENPAESGGKEEMYQSIHLFNSLEQNTPDNI